MELVIPGSALRLAMDCTTRPGISIWCVSQNHYSKTKPFDPDTNEQLISYLLSLGNKLERKKNAFVYCFI